MTAAQKNAERVEAIRSASLNLTPWEEEFLRNVAVWKHLTAKQEAMLEKLEARANGGVQDAKIAFLDAMEAAGIIPVDPIADLLGPDKIRFHCQGDRKGRKNGWAKFYDDGVPAGSFGHYKLSITCKWRLEDDRVLTQAEREQVERDLADRKTQREADLRAKHKSAANFCTELWGRAGPVDPAHPYLVAKGIAGEGLRQVGDTLLVPMLDYRGHLWNLQRIRPDGMKLYVKDARAEQLMLVVGEPSDRLVVAEGYATGAVVRRATGAAVAIAFCWSNLDFTARAMRWRHPTADIVIAADDDAHLIDNPQIQRNLGLDAARAAALTIGGRLALPPRRHGMPACARNTGRDFADVGKDMGRRAIADAVLSACPVVDQSICGEARR